MSAASSPDRPEAAASMVYEAQSLMLKNRHVISN
jgi:hypothetical protein